MTCDCPCDMMFPWQPYFDRHVFQNFIILFLDGFWRFWTNPEIQDGATRWPAFRNGYTIIVMCHHNLIMRMSKETFSDILSTLQVSLS